MEKIKKAAVLISLLFFLSGCAAVWLGVGAVGGIGAYKYIEGRVEREYPLEYGKAWNATNSALANLQISVSNSIDEGAVGKIAAVRRDGKKITVKLTDRGQGVTTISVRVGMLGDRDEAKRLHEEIASVSGIR
jgi:hypothetical protein